MEGDATTHQEPTPRLNGLPISFAAENFDFRRAEIVHSHARNSKQARNPQGGFVETLARLWSDRGKFLAIAKELFGQAWSASQKDARLRKVTQICVFSISAAVALLSWLVLLTVLESALLVLSGVVGIMLMISAFAVPLFITVFVLFAACTGTVVVAALVYQTYFEQPGEMAKKVE
mmetsp:Transcript_15079/g.29367  ORF Transcript_15079/g.29367 Transcript_15079/m.29367 type:complete len:176 (-) Transcript_15079:1293-1820(-)